MFTFRKHQIFIICVLGIIFSTSAWPQTENTLNRPFNGVVVMGNSFPTFIGKYYGFCRLFKYSVSADQWEPIPFQVDEYDGFESWRVI